MQLNLTLEWADGEYDFRLPWAGCAEIERKASAAAGKTVTIQEIFERVMMGHAASVDVVEIIRQALLGGTGGMVDGEAVECKPALVNQLIERYVTGDGARPFTESWTLASTVLHTFMIGYEPSAEKGVKKKSGQQSASAST